MLREQQSLGHSVVSSLMARHHASHIASDTPGPVTKYSLIVKRELGQGSRTPQENHQRALRGKNSKFRLEVWLSRHDGAVLTKLLVNSAERSTKWCHSNYDEAGDDAVQRLEMPSNTVERKATVAPTVILRRVVHTAHIKRNEDPASPS